MIKFKLNELRQREWKRDVEAFERCKRLLEIAYSDRTISYALSRLKELQEKWPNHKLGDMPDIE